MNELNEWLRRADEANLLTVKEKKNIKEAIATLDLTPLTQYAIADLCDAIYKLGQHANSDVKPAPDKCPFCGGNSTLQSAIDKVFWVKCEECGASSQPESTSAAAIQHWNHRYTPKGMDLDSLYSNFCARLENMTNEELDESFYRAEEDSKDSYIFDDYDN